MKFIQKFRILRIAALSVMLGATTFFSVGFVDNYFEVSKNLDIFASIYRELNIYYVDETDPGKMMTKGIDAMLETLDPYTNYIPESEIEDYRFMTTGQYGGIGALISQRGDKIIVADPYEGFPAQKSDIRAGDEIIEIDGRVVSGKRTDEVSKILKGQPNTTVKIAIRREGVATLIEKQVTREEIKINSVSYSGMLDANTGYIRLTSFTENAGKEVKDALVELKKNEGMSSLILDLRSNPGGLLNEAVNITNVFVNQGVDVVSTKGKVKEWDKTYKALKTPLDTNIPVVVLVNSMSASASEIVSGAMQDLDRGVVIGQRTFGKGLVQVTRPLSYNAQLKLTTAKYYIPSGRCIQALDYSHRNEDGSVGNIPDSLIKPFKTKNGRVVYDGGGVVPDFQLDVIKVSPITQSLLVKSLIFDYATLYRIKNANIGPASSFKISDKEFDDFVAYLSDKEYDYSTKSEKSLEELKKHSENEKYFNDIEAEYNNLKAKMKHDKQKDIQRNKEEIMGLLSEEIASRFYFQKGRTEAAFLNDPEIKEAIKIVNDSQKYTATLKGNQK